jgi:hypothetical protein
LSAVTDTPTDPDELAHGASDENAESDQTSTDDEHDKAEEFTEIAYEQDRRRL